jgi:hypothetical protein
MYAGAMNGVRTAKRRRSPKRRLRIVASALQRASEPGSASSTSMTGMSETIG